jgi:hypothetical protein
VFWNLYSREKNFSNRKQFFLFEVFYHICDFSQDFSFYNSAWIRIRFRIRTLFSDSDLARTFGFEFGSTALLPTPGKSILPIFGAGVFISFSHTIRKVAPVERKTGHFRFAIDTEIPQIITVEYRNRY